VLSLNSLLQILLDRAVTSLPRGISLLSSWPDGKTVHSLPHGSKFDFRPLFAYHEPTRGRVLVQLCDELVVSYCIDFSVQHSSRTTLSASFSLQHSLSPCDHFLCHLIDSFVRQRHKHSFYLGRSQSQRTHFSGFPQLLDGAYLKQLYVFSPTQGSHAPPSLLQPVSTSSLPLSQRHFLHFPVKPTRLASVFPFLPHISSSEWPFPSPSNFGSLTLFLVYATAHPNCPASCTPLDFLWTLTPGCFCVFNCCIHFSLRLPYCFCRFLCLLFCACSCTVFFLRVSSRETIHANFSVGGILI